MWDAIRKTLGVVVISAAIAENTWLVLYVSAATMAVRHSTNCLDRPLNELAALLVYLATGTSLVAAVWYYERVGHKVVDLWDRLLWTGVALAFVPATTVFFGVCGFIFGPLGWFIGAVLGGAIPYLVLERVL